MEVGVEVGVEVGMEVGAWRLKRGGMKVMSVVAASGAASASQTALDRHLVSWIHTSSSAQAPPLPSRPRPSRQITPSLSALGVQQTIFT
jgi:hypothetical protein